MLVPAELLHSREKRDPSYVSIFKLSLASLTLLFLRFSLIFVIFQFGKATYSISCAQFGQNEFVRACTKHHVAETQTNYNGFYIFRLLDILINIICVLYYHSIQMRCASVCVCVCAPILQLFYSMLSNSQFYLHNSFAAHGILFRASMPCYWCDCLLL